MTLGPDNLYNAIAKTVEAAGLKSPDLYFTKPTPKDIQNRMKATDEQQQPNLGMQRLRMEASLATEKARVDSETTRRKLEMVRELKLAEIQPTALRDKTLADRRATQPNLATRAGGNIWRKGAQHI